VLHTLRGLIGDDAFFRAVRLLVYGTEQPQPGQFQPRYGSTKEFMDIVYKVTGSNYDWFFQTYLYQAALPELSAVRDGDTLRLVWKTPADIAFPMPVEVRIGKEIHTVSMSLGFGELPLPAGTTYTLDPRSRVLRRAEHIETFQKFREEQVKGKKG
jgi:aminopeptidase N